MFGRKELEERRFVVMDGSNKRFVKEIIGVSEMIMGKPGIFNRRNIKIQRLDRNHPTMLVFTITSDYRRWSVLREILQKHYSEQCVFGAPL